MSENSRSHLVVVVPGIGGSRLAVPSDPSRVVWDAGFPDVANLLVRPERLSVDRYPVLRPAGLIRSKKLFGVLTKIEGYEQLLGGLGSLPDVVLDDGTGPQPLLNANVVAIGYDFRLGVAKAAEYLDSQLMPRLEALWPRRGDRRGRVIFVTHSMGGLVARYWLAQEDRAWLCRELITLGTPHRGAPKALDVLANGVPVKGVYRFKGRVRELLRSWQGVYDLLPTEREVQDLSAAREHDWRDVYDLPVAWDGSMTAAARSLHGSIRQAWEQMPAGVRPSVQPRIGFGHGTQSRCVWDGRRVRVTTEAPERPGLGRRAKDLGDGTVPALSGLPSELPEPPSGLWAAFRHGQIVNIPDVFDRIQAAEGYPLVRPTEGARLETVLGLDLDELTLAGEPTPVAATVRGIDLSGNPGRCVATVVPEGEGFRGVSAELDWDSAGDRFLGEVPALPSGGYTIIVDWAADDALSTQASLEAVDPDVPGLAIA